MQQSDERVAQLRRARPTRTGVAADDAAILAHSQTREPLQLSWTVLRDQAARTRAGLHRLGVGRGDRVVAYLPNIPETLIAFIEALAR